MVSLRALRIALNLKRLSYEYVSVLSLPAGAYRRLNPQGLIPALGVDGVVIPQSGAILDFLERSFPSPSLLSADAILRAQALGFSQLIVGEMHALTIHRVRRVLKVEHWMAEGFGSLEETLAGRREAWPFCFGAPPDGPTSTWSRSCGTRADSGATSPPTRCCWVSRRGVSGSRRSVSPVRRTSRTSYRPTRSDVRFARCRDATWFGSWFSCWS